MTTLLFTNCKYYRGGGKKAKRIRLNQNYTMFIRLQRDLPLLDWTDEQLIFSLKALTLGRVEPSPTTKLKRIKS